MDSTLKLNISPNLKITDEKTGQTKEDLLAYIKELEQRQDFKLKLLKRNRNCAKNRPETKLDSSLKKNTAFVKKLRNFSASQLDSLLKDCSSLNLSKYLSEVVSSLAEAKLKSADIPAAVQICTELNCMYLHFAPILHDHWTKLLSIKKDEPIVNARKLSIDLRFYSELISCGVFSHHESLPVLGTVLTALVSDRKYQTIRIIVSFCKFCGDDFAGLLPKWIRKLSDQYCIPVPCSQLLSTDKQANVKKLFKEYYSSLCQYLENELKQIQLLEKEKKAVNKLSDVQQDRIPKDEVRHTELQSLVAGAYSLAELLDVAPPDLPETSDCEESSFFLDAEECFEGNIWEDEDTRLFYTQFPDLTEFLPQKPKAQKHEEKQSKTTSETDQSLKKEVPKKSNIGYKLNDDLKKDEYSLLEDQKPNISKTALDNYLKHLPSLTKKDMVDNAALEFVLYYNSKHGRKKLITALLSVHRTRLDLLSLYGRLIAVLNPVIPEIGQNISQQLKAEVNRHIEKKNQINIESKIKAIRFIGELVNFNIFAKQEALLLLKQLLEDFSHHHIEMACNLLEVCGRTLCHNMESYHLTKQFLEQMMRVKSTMVLDARYVYLIENTYYLIISPEASNSKYGTKTVVQMFIDKVVFQDLMYPGCGVTVLSLMRSVDWECEETAAYAIQCLASPHKIKYQRIRALADLVTQLTEYQGYVGTRVVDSIIEDIRLGMEMNMPIMNQRMVALVKYLGELYTYRLLEDDDIFKQLYTILTFGISMDHTNPSALDPPFCVFRIRLILILLETCVPYFHDYNSSKKLKYFFTYFQSYYWFKHSSPLWTQEIKFPFVIEQMFKDSLVSMCPQIKPAKNYEQAQQAVKILSKKILTDVINYNKDSQQLETFLEFSDEEDDSITKAEVNNNSKNADHHNSSFRQIIDDDNEFQTNLDRMIMEDFLLRDKFQHSNVDISIPLAHKKEHTEQDSNFILILKKGNKQQCKSVELPPDSELLRNLKNREEEERKERKEVKQRTLNFSQRIEEEANAAEIN